MSKTLNVYWSSINDANEDWSILFDEPTSLISELSLNKNKNNPDNNLLRCPAVTDLGKNLFVIKAPLTTSASFIIEDGRVSNKMDTNDSKWIVNRAPSLHNQLLTMYSHPIILFAEEDVDVMLSDPYFSNAPHKTWGSIVPGIFNCGAWFRPLQIEFNVWEGITDVSLVEGEHLGYIKFFTDKKVVLKRFSMTEELKGQARVCSSAGNWEPKVPLSKRYDRFKRTKRDKFVLDNIKKNLL
jgi:hypothetical protein